MTALAATSLEHDIQKDNPNEQLFKEMGLDTCYAQDFAISPLLCEIVRLEKTLRIQENDTVGSNITESSRLKVLNEISIKKNILIQMLYKLEKEFAQRNRLTQKGQTVLSLQDRQERASFVRNTSKQTLVNMLHDNVTNLESLLESPPQDFTSADDEVGRTAIKFNIELIQLFS